MLRLRQIIIVSLLSALAACRSNPFGDTDKTIEEFNLYTTDFAAQTDGGMKTALLEVIGGARVTLNCAFSALTLTDVTDAIINRARGGVQVKIAFDGDVRTNDPGSLALQASGAFTIVTVPLDGTQSQLLYGNTGAGVMRHNYCLADERYIYLSTAPPDATQMTTTPNVAIKVGTPQFGLARDFLRESNMFSQLLFGNGKAKTDFTTKFTARDQVIGAFWGPQESPLNVLAVELSEATSRVDFYSTAFLTTNSSNANLDVAKTLDRLEEAKGLPLGKYFSSQALFDSSSQAYTLSNPAQYVNSNVRVGANIFVIDRGLTSAKAFIYTGSLRSQANSSDDSVLIELRGKNVADMVAAYLDRIGAVSVVASSTGDTSAAGAVVISEINWMGSYSNAQADDDGDEFVELYNTTASPINISRWGFACTTGGTNINGFFALPAGAVIPAGGYFTIAAKSSGAFSQSMYITPFKGTGSSTGISNGSVQCKLTNGPATAGSTPTDFASVPGTIIDQAGDASTAFELSSEYRLGFHHTTYNLKLPRSMERRFPIADGTNLANWQTNMFVPGASNRVSSGFELRTFASVGAASSATPTLPALKINEIGISSGSNDFVEIYNSSNQAIDLATASVFLQRDASCDLSSGPTGIIALTGTIPAQGYYVVANSGHSLVNVNQTNLENISVGYCVVLTTTNSRALSASLPTIIDWVTIAGSGTAENASRTVTTGADGAISRIPNGVDTNMNADDFRLRPATPGAVNGIPTVTTSPANAATCISANQNIIITFSESMSTASGTVSANGVQSGNQGPLACTWSTTSLANDTCTINPPTDFHSAGESVAISLNGFATATDFLAPTLSSFSFTTGPVAPAPTVTNVVVASTNPANGSTPFNTGTSTVTITGTSFLCASSVRLDDLNGVAAAANTTLTSVIIDSATQITATVPAGVRTNGTTGWNVIVTTPNGANATSSVRFVPRAGLLISEVLLGTTTAAANEFVELYNPTAQSLNLCTIASGASILKLRRRTATGGTDAALTLTAVNCTIAARGFYLAVSTAATAETWYAKRDATFSAAMGASNMVYISLSTNLNSVLDLVGWGTITDANPGGGCEGGNASCTNLATNDNSIERKPAGGTGHATDTDNNASDFNNQSVTITPRGTIDPSEPL